MAQRSSHLAATTQHPRLPCRPSFPLLARRSRHSLPSMGSRIHLPLILPRPAMAAIVMVVVPTEAAAVTAAAEVVWAAPVGAWVPVIAGVPVRAGVGAVSPVAVVVEAVVTAEAVTTVATVETAPKVHGSASGGTV